MKSIKRSLIVGLFILLVSSIYLSSAITGSIGNSRMIIRAAPGDNIEKYVLIKNVNDVNVNVQMFVGGDLANSTKLKENNFSLMPGEEKKAYFTLKAEEEGTFETKINIKFIPEEGSAVGLSSTIIFIAGEDYTDNPDVITDLSEYKEQTNSIFNIFEKSQTNSIGEGKKLPNTLILLSISTLFLAIVLIGLIFFALRKKEGKNKIRKISLKHEK